MAGSDQGGVEVITPNPQTSGGARWNYLAAWGYALKVNHNDEAKAQEFVKELFTHVPVLDSGARGATTTFVERGIGDVLAWENEAYLSINELGPDKFEIVNPSVSILAEPPVAVVDKNVDKRGTREVAEAYLQYLYSEEGQTIAAENYYRPTLASVADKYKEKFPTIELFTLKDVFGTWEETQTKHFHDGGIFNQIYVPGADRHNRRRQERMSGYGCTSRTEARQKSPQGAPWFWNRHGTDRPLYEFGCARPAVRARSIKPD